MGEQELTNFTNIECNTNPKDEPKQTCIWESNLIGPENAVNVSFQMGLWASMRRDRGTCDINAKWEVYNNKLNRWEKIYEKIDSFGGSEGAAYFLFYYVNEKPYYIAYTGEIPYKTRYYCCPEGFDEDLLPKETPGDTVDWRCVYPDECLKYMKKERHWIYCIRRPYFLNKDYINNGIIKFRTTLLSSNGCGLPSSYNHVEVGYSVWGIPPPCECTEWQNKECISETQRRQTRSCNPSGCDNEERIIDDLSCLIPCECTEWQNKECISETQRRQTRSCNPAGCEEEERIIDDFSCYIPPRKFPWWLLGLGAGLLAIPLMKKFK